MAISTLDFRGTFGSSRVSVSSPRSEAGALRRVPVTALVAGLVSMIEGVGLLAAALTGLDGVLSSPQRPAGPLVAIGLIVLAGWIVLAAGSGAALIDGSGRRTVAALATTEIALGGALVVVAATTSLLGKAPFGLPWPVVALLAVALPAGKLLLAHAPTARQWVAQRPRARDTRPDPVAAHRGLAVVTLGLIGAGLVALIVLAPVAAGGAGVDGTVSREVATP